MRRRSATWGTINGRGKERTTTEEEDPDVSNEYLIANPISNISFGSPRNECEPLLASRGPPAFSRMIHAILYLCGAVSRSLLRMQKRNESLEEREGKVKKKYFYFRSLFPEFYAILKDLVMMELQEE